MTRITIAHKPADALPRLCPDGNNILFKHPLPNLVLLYFFTAFFANYVIWVNINNAILVILVLFAFIYKPRGLSIFSPLIVFYALLTLLSVLSHLYWLPAAGLPDSARTMPIALASMIACRFCATPALFERSIVLNILPFAVLLPLGASHEKGRYVGTFLTETIAGGLLALGPAFCLSALWEGRRNWKFYIVLFVSLFYVLNTGSRSPFIYIAAMTLTLLVYKQDGKCIWPKRLLYGVALLVLLFMVVMPTMLERHRIRFGDDYSFQTNISDIISGNPQDRSSHDRLAFIDLAFIAANDNWFGFGNGNFPFVVRTYAYSYLPEAGHPHSGLAESLITAGYPGLLLYIAMLIYLARIGRGSLLITLCLVWVVLMFFLDTNLNSRILWPLLSIAERELQISESKVITEEKR